jgi:hypothetical protein
VRRAKGVASTQHLRALPVMEPWFVFVHLSVLRQIAAL